jgi:hypothetical protein
MWKIEKSASGNEFGSLVLESDDYWKNDEIRALIVDFSSVGK